MWGLIALGAAAAVVVAMLMICVVVTFLADSWYRVFPNPRYTPAYFWVRNRSN